MSARLENPRAARRAARSPFCAALPAWNGLHIVPNCDLSPAACVPAIPSAMAVASASRPKEPGAGRRGAKGADRAGRVKTEIVVPRLQRRADPAGGLIPRDEGGDHLAAGALLQFGEGEQARQDRHRGMARHRHIDVVIVERVSRSAIDERRRQRRQSGLMADDARLWGAAGLGQLVEQEPHQLVAGPGDRHTEIVENALPGELTRVPR